METKKLYLPFITVLPDNITFSLVKSEEGKFKINYTEKFGDNVPEDILKRTLELVKTLYPLVDINKEDKSFLLTISALDKKNALRAILFELLIQYCCNKSDLEELVRDIKLMLPEIEPLTL